MGAMSAARLSFGGRQRWIRGGSRNRRPVQGNLWPQPKDNEGSVVLPFAKRDIWEHQQEEVDCPIEASVGIPKDNAGAIALLESWLKLPVVDNSEAADEMRNRIDENRLSDRKFFS